VASIDGADSVLRNPHVLPNSKVPWLRNGLHRLRRPKNLRGADMSRNLCVLRQSRVLGHSSMRAWRCDLNHAMTVEERS
jgi:hypothetical protein